MINHELQENFHKKLIDYFFKVKVVFWLALLVILFYFHYVGLFGRGSIPVILVLFVEICLSVFYFPIRLQRPEKVVPYNLFSIWIDVLAVTVALHYLGGIYSMIWCGGYLLLIAVSSIFMTSRGRLLFVIYVCLAFSLLCFLEVGNIIPRINIFQIPVSNQQDLFCWLSTLVLIFLTALISNQFNRILARFQRLANLGRMSTEMAHELRTPLQVIEGLTEYQCNEEGKREIKTQLEKVSRFIKEILALGREELQSYSRVRLRAVVDHAMNLVFQTTGPLEDMRVEKRYNDENLFVFVDIDQITKAFSNLIRNAIDSMKNQGTLSVNISRNGFEWAQVEVKDTGPGIERSEFEKIFEPFYTTKTGMRGVGLGLAIVKKFVEANSGRIEVDSQVGGGSTFTVSFPVSPDEKEAKNDI